MALVKIHVLYGHLEGRAGFARDPTGFLALEAGIFREHGLDVSWEHVQGTEERQRRLENGSADISLVVGRAALQHYLKSQTTRLLGSSMNSCPYYLVAQPGIGEVRGLRGCALACRESVGRGAPLERLLRERGGGGEIAVDFVAGDQHAFDALVGGAAAGALLPRPYALVAEERGFRRVSEWPDAVDDPLPVTLETTARLAGARYDDYRLYLAAHRAAIRYAKQDRAATVAMLGRRFGHSAWLAGKIYGEYLVWLDDRLTVVFGKLEALAAQVCPEFPGGARRLAAEWIAPGAVRE
ncbi:MAG TPA: hypothetical protein VNL14_10220 [Candidatus Acidoferrales bacterium]|nr:hypothetical protein [Candidatus Acidoferrales bacterium]